jgi:hypothetical protein
MTKEKMLKIILDNDFHKNGELYRAVTEDDYSNIPHLFNNYSETYREIKPHILNYIRLQKLKQYDR